MGTLMKILTVAGALMASAAVFTFCMQLLGLE
jgi:hypothetical protein